MYVEVVVPYGQGELVGLIHKLGVVDSEEYEAEGTVVVAHVPLGLSRQLIPYRRNVGEEGWAFETNNFSALDISKVEGLERIIDVNTL